jgi:parallel beta-helix repeat protein/predicted outer membrane repeat protein
MILSTSSLKKQIPSSSLLAIIALFFAHSLSAQEYIPSGNLIFVGSATLVETDQRAAFNTTPNGGTPATLGQSNLALASNGAAAFESSRIASTYGDDKLNNGVYGVTFPDDDDATRPWISLEADAGGWGGVKFGSPATLGHIGFGSRFDGRSDGVFTMQYTTSNFAGVNLEVPAQVDALSWVNIGFFNSTTPTEFGRHLFVLTTPVANVTGVRIIASQGGSTITEIEAYSFGNSQVVTTLADSGAGSLRDTIASATSGDTLTFDASLSGKTITLEGTQLLIDKELNIDASALAKGITIDAAGSSRVFKITSGSVVTMRSLMLTGGNATGGFPENSGGAIYSNLATLSLISCTLSGNSASKGGGIYNKGSFTPTLSLTACTLSGNSASGSGGGIYNVSGSSTKLSLTACTLSGNSAVQGGGIFSFNTILSLENTILAGNTAADGPDLGEFGASTTTLLGKNLVSDTSGNNGLAPAAALIVATNPKLSPLGHYGGSTQTMHPLAGSLAIDAAGTSNPGGTDQRGFSRFVNGALDIGAVETGPITTVDNVGDGVGTATTLRKAIADATTPGTVIRFNSTPFNGQSGDDILNGADFDISSGQVVFIDASNITDGVTIDSGGINRIFNVNTGATLALHSLTLTGGNANGGSYPSDSGGAIYSDHATLSLTACTLSGNSAVQGGGIRNSGNLILNRCTLTGNSAAHGGSLYTDTDLSGTTTTLTHCTLSDNQATLRGGGIYNNDGKTVLIHCTISGNTAPAGLGSGVSSYGDTFTKTEVNGCIIAGNSNSDIDKSGGAAISFTSSGANLIGTGDSIAPFNQTGDTTGTTNPKLSPLGHYGGPVQTMHPLAGSAAIDPAPAAATSPLSTDARGFPRVVRSLVDIGAVETGSIMTVDNIGDGGGTATTLRKAIADATTPGTVIRFNPTHFLGYPDNDILNGAEFAIGAGKTIFIDASNITRGVTIDSGGTNRIFNVNTGANLALHSLTLTGGNTTGNGGGILNDHATLSLTACTLSGNSADVGGGIYSDGNSSGNATLSLTACTLSGNSANAGGGIYSGGISGSATLNLTACTLSGNSAGNQGGGIYSTGYPSGSATLSLTACTLSGNFADFGGGGGIYSRGGSSGSATLNLDNTILAGNTGSKPDISGAVDSHSGINFIGDTNGATGLGTLGTHYLTGDPKLSQLGHYGGPVQTMHPLAGSAAIDPATAATTSPLSTDARGFARVVNSLVDIGAVETGPIITVDHVGDGVGTATTLRKAIADATTPGTVIRFNSTPFNGEPADTILNGLELAIGSSQVIFIDASNITEGVTIDSGGNDRIFNINTGANLALHSLTLTGGKVLGSRSGGAIYSNSATLSLTACTLSGNSANFGGGISSRSNAILSLTACTLSGNSAGSEGGGIYNDNNSALSLTACTLSGNFANFGGGISISGGFSSSPSLSLTACTLSGNSAGSEGGGIFSSGLIQLRLNNTILAGNTAPTGPDLRETVSNVITTTLLGVNLISDTSGNNGLSPSSAYIVRIQPKLSPLGHYGGSTQTMHPLAGSAAIDAAGTSNPGGTDQRGFSRFVNGALDIGAVETGPITTVDNVGDGVGTATTLRKAIADASTPGTVILFNSSPFNGEPADDILNGAELVIGAGKSVFIDASDITGGVTIDSGGSNGIFEVSSSATLALHSLTLTGGRASDGGAIINYGTLTVNKTTIADNSATNNGGGIFNTSTLTVTNSTFSRNRAVADGGAIGNYFNSTLTLTNSTLSGNSADSSGGGIRNFADSTLTLTNSIVAGNRAPSGSDIAHFGNSLTRRGANIIGDNSTTSVLAGAPNTNGDYVGTNASPFDSKLSPLGHYGGPVQTMHPLAGSAAIDPAGAAATSPLSTDARGFPRIVRSKIDIGAVETGPIITVDNVGDGVGTATTLRKAIADVNVNTPGTVIRFNPTLYNIIHNDLEFAIGAGKTIFIDASDISGGVTIDADYLNRIFKVNTGANLALHSLTLTAGNASAGSSPANVGGAIYNDHATLNLTSCTLSDNSAGNQGGGIYNIGASSSATLSLTACTLSGNSAGNRGGGIYNFGSSPGSAMLSLTACTLSGNSAGSEGGGIYNTGGSSGSATLRLTNCTLSGNRANNDGGGGIYIRGTTTTINHCTFSGNFADFGGGISILSGSLAVGNSIIAGNSDSLGFPNLLRDGGTLTRSGANIIGSNNVTTTTEFPTGAPNGNGDYVGTTASRLDPRLLPLGSYVGSTQTMPPLLGSPAIEGAILLASTPLTDQHGNPRTSGPLPDIGAVEAVAMSLLSLSSGDGDSIPDILEGFGKAYPHLNSFVDDSALDTDGDGSSDAEEIANMTDPLDSSSLLRILAMIPVAGFDPATNPVFEITINTFPGLSYRLESSATLTGFIDMPGTAFTATGFSEQLNVTLGANGDFVRAQRD